MNPRYCIVALFSIVVLGLTAFANSASAVEPPSTTLMPPSGPSGLPRFGFSSSTIFGYGEEVVWVRPGGRAERLGLEPGDVILSLNGYRLTYTGSWDDALSRALSNGGMIYLRIRDVRTGQVRVRQTFVNFGNGPVQPYNYYAPKTFTKDVTPPAGAAPKLN